MDQFNAINPLKLAKKGARVRNLHDMAGEARDAAECPRHARKPHRVFNMHDSKLLDPFDYFREGITKEEEEAF